MSLPLAWVERIFTKMNLVYGRDFTSRWEGISLTDVMGDWGRELAALQANPAAIKWGLEHLPPSRPPTVLEFRALCNARPDPAPPRLPAPATNPETISRVIAALQEVRPLIERGKAAALMDSLRERRAAGTLSAGQKDFLARAEAGMPRGQAGGLVDFTPIPTDVLPPAMRGAA